MFFLLLCHIIQLCLVEFAKGSGAGLHFTGKYDQRAEFEQWDLSTNGSMSFLFQTHIRSSLLLYQQNKKNGDYLDVFIYKGALRLRIKLGFCKDFVEKLLIEGDYSDSKWHNVTIGLGFKTISFSVDNNKKPKVVTCRNIVKFETLRKRRWSTMYLGGIAINDNFYRNSWANPLIHNEIVNDDRIEWFKGCIGDLIYRKGVNRPVKAKSKRKVHAVADCDSACSADKLPPVKCSNGGLCIDHILYFDCDCKGTGYEGTYCAKESSMVFINRTGYIYYQMLEPNIEWSMKNNRISFRVVPLNGDGVILYLGKDKDHLVVEMTQRRLQIAINLGGGQFVMRSNTTFNISQYHFVEIVRRQKRLTLDINRGLEVQSKLIPGTLFSLDLRGSERIAYIGGGPGSLSLSSSKANFSGFLQQFKFDRFKILDKAMYDQSDKRFGFIGKVNNGEDFPHLLPFDKSIVGSGCSELNDDEDNEGCQPTTVRCLTRECLFGKQSTGKELTNTPFTMTLPVKTEQGSPTPGVVMSLRKSRASQHSVSPWIIIIIVAAAVVAVLITIFLLYRWNNRYSGSFKPSKSEPGEGVQPVTRGYEQPAFYVSPNKPKGEETMA